jgi:hypothetical protein
MELYYVHHWSLARKAASVSPVHVPYLLGTIVHVSNIHSIDLWNIDLSIAQSFMALAHPRYGRSQARV